MWVSGTIAGSPMRCLDRGSSDCGEERYKNDCKGSRGGGGEESDQFYKISKV